MLRRRGWTSNRQRVQHLRREDNLLSLRRVKRVRTTASSHTLTVYPNLVPELTLAGLNQLWVAAITYLRLGREFGGRVGRLLAALHWLAAGSPARGTADAGSFAPGPAGRALPPGWGSNIHSGGFYLLAMAQAPRTCYVPTQLPGCISTRWDHPACYSPHFGAYSILLAASPLTMVQG